MISIAYIGSPIVAVEYRSEERYQICCKAFPSQIEIAGDIEWQQRAGRFELTGAGI